jgi:type IV pilus assembly protein PilA
MLPPHYHNVNGFTLLELLIVMSIVSTLAAIAIPRYAAYKATAFDTRAELDLRSVAIAEEAYFLQHEEYLACSDEACSQLPGIRRLSAGVKLEVRSVSDGFVATSSHPLGTGRIFTWDSSQGGLVEQ